VVATRDSVPRRRGTMVVDSDETVAGSISGGCVESKPTRW
jgi:xanthine/CO dehydrogenase XdhC/CoxF family maturation factor